MVLGLAMSSGCGGEPENGERQTGCQFVESRAIIVAECINAKEIFVSKTLTCTKAGGKKTTIPPAAQFL